MENRLEKEISKLSKQIYQKEFESFQQSVGFALKYLSHLRRSSGESYAVHGIQVALTLAEWTKEVSLLKVAVLHDLFIHPHAESLIHKAPLTEDEKLLARRMHQLRRLFINSNTQDLDQFIHAFIDEERLLPLRMAHRVNDIRHLECFKPEVRKQLAKETLEMYTAIAGRVGMHFWRQEMEDACFKVVHPSIARNLEYQFEMSRLQDEKCLQSAQDFLQKTLKKNGISCRIEKRVKGLYSTYRKMMLKHRSFYELTDRLALRLIVEEPMDCYKALGIVHHYMRPIPGKLKDYIGAPKANNYQSIHTVVYPQVGVTALPLEIQIRTVLMDKVCQFGVAAHWDYKKTQYAALSSDFTKVSLMRNIAQLRKEAQTPSQFGKILRQYFDGKHIIVFDAHEKIHHVKKSFSALDFIRHTYPLSPHKLKRVKVNGKRVAWNHTLKDGDVVTAEFEVEKKSD